MKFLSFFLITFLLIINISVKLLVVDQEAEIERYGSPIIESLLQDGLKLSNECR